jgi:nitroimidazol reductase NimA-like FMN-containing flavoprotein (pyridoxamine 5'-phosphate oxidase superfamily)
MRRKDKQLTMEECEEVLAKGEHGVLATTSENGYPYVTPLNFVFANNNLYFHSALEGEKLDNISECNKVSFCVSTDVELLADKFDTNYKSVILFGRAEEIYGIEKDEALLELIKKYSPDHIEQGEKYISRMKEKARVVKINVEHLTGKAQV